MICRGRAALGLLYLGTGQRKQAFGYTLLFKDFVLPNRDAMICGESPPTVQAVVDVTAPNGATRGVSSNGTENTPTR